MMSSSNKENEGTGKQFSKKSLGFYDPLCDSGVPHYHLLPAMMVNKRPTIQCLVDRSFEKTGVHIKEVPSGVALQVPRFARKVRSTTSDFILPDPVIKIHAAEADNCQEVEMKLFALIFREDFQFKALVKKIDDWVLVESGAEKDEDDPMDETTEEQNFAQLGFYLKPENFEKLKDVDKVELSEDTLYILEKASIFMYERSDVMEE